MITVSPAFLDAMYNQDRRSFVYTVGIALADGTSMTLTNEDLFDGGISIEESVSEDSTLQLGSAIINKCTVVLQNFDGRYNYYDFQNARVVVHIGLNIGGTVESFQKGTYIVDEQDFNNSLLTLTCLDNMSLFERAYSDSALAYPASMLEIVKDACTACGVIMATDVFPCCNLIAPSRPNMQGVTFRDVISWAAQCCGCNASIDNLGRLEISYYNFDFLDSITDELLESWTGEVELTAENDAVLTTESGENLILDAYGFNVFKSLYTINVGYNDATISGVRVRTENPESTGDDDAILEYTSGTESYELLIENNGLINTTNAQEIADAVGNRLIGATYRKANFTHPSDPTVAAGNIAVIYDGHGNAYRTIISSTTFTAGDRQNTVSAGSNPPRIPDQPPQYTRVVRTTEDGYGRSTQDGSVRSTGYEAQAIRTRNLLRAASPVSSGYNAVRRYSEQTKSIIRQSRALSRLGGLYYTAIADPGGGTIHYLHNKPKLEDSEIQIVISDTGIHVTANGLDDDPDWYGMEVNGDLIANILQANGINADWINAGTIQGLVIETVPSDVTYTGETGTYHVKFVYSEEGMRMALVPTSSSSSARYVSSKESIITPYIATETIFDSSDGVRVDYPMAKISKPVFENTFYYLDYYNALQTGTFSAITNASELSSATLSRPSSLTNFTFGTTWDCWVRKRNNIVTIGYNFNGYFTSTSSTGGTLFTLPSEYAPIANTRYINCVNQSGVRYLLTINTSGIVTLQNTQGAAASSAQFFRDQITFVQ